MTEESQPTHAPIERVLVVMAHPDDAEFSCGATVSQWTSQGVSVAYVVLTGGDKGNHDPAVTIPNLVERRMQEQRAAAALLGVTEVHFMGEEDGFLQPTRELRKRLVRIIRQFRPDIVICQNPETHFWGDSYINHPDHRNAGAATLEAIFPAAGNLMFFPDLLAEGLQPHSIRELWLSMVDGPNHEVDITDLLDVKIAALRQHVSQFDDLDEMEKWLRERWGKAGPDHEIRFYGSFKRMWFD